MTGKEYGGTDMAGGNITDTGGHRGRQDTRGSGMAYSGASLVTLPYAEPQAVTRLGQLPKRPSTTGVAAVVPHAYTIVGTRTLGSSARLRSVTVGRTQE